MKKRTLTLLTAACLLVPTLLADDSPLAVALTAHRLTLRLDEGKLSGPGADFLVAEGKDSQFFLIGEDHGGVESPRFAAAMYGALQPAGYRHVAVEAGPITGERLEGLATADAIGRFSVAHPFALPFFNWREEAEYLAAVVKSKPSGVKRAVWGIDQEFVLSPSFHLERLAALAKTAKAKEAVAAMTARNLAGDKAMTEELNPTTVLLMKATPADFDALAAAFPDNAEAARIVRELRESAAIYQMYATGRQYDNNLTRSNLMKRNFRTFYDEAVAAGEKQPRVLLKFGMSHMLRGRSFVNVHDVGTMLPELAAMNGTRAFSVLVVYRQGAVNEFTPFSTDPNARAAAYDPVSSRNLFFDPKPLFDAADASEWTLFDFRALRPLMGKKLPMDEALARMVWGFDAMVVVPVVHPATLF
jgi:hypothetical protein